MQLYTWGYHDSADSAHVSLDHGTGRVEDLFDVALYDPEYINPDTGRNAQDQSLFDLRRLIALANAAIKAGLPPEPDKD